MTADEPIIVGPEPLAVEVLALPAGDGFREYLDQLRREITEAISASLLDVMTHGPYGPSNLRAAYPIWAAGQSIQEAVAGLVY